MDIEIIHDPDHLPVRRRYASRNARGANQYYQKAMEYKRTRGGLRVRFTYDVVAQTVGLEGRTAACVDTVEQILRAGGSIGKRIR